jgi:hypothetical protein
MWNEPTIKQLSKIPGLYQTEKIKDKKIYTHFFIAGTDWFVAEYDPKENLFFGYTILNNDNENAEWGYFSFQEIKDIKMGFIEVDRDLYWQVKKTSEVEQIERSGGI